MNDLNLSAEPFLSAQMITKNFRIGNHSVSVLKGVSLSAGRGEWLSLTGASGSGKTTLLDILGTISRPDSGRLIIDGTDISALSAGKTVVFRRKRIGFVFQAYHILPELSILENVMLPGLLDGKSPSFCRKRAEALLDETGLSHRIRHRPNELSGGEQQRAAIARALMNSPRLLLADEPTGNLDSVTGAGILDLFKEFHAEGHMAVVMVTHDRNVANLADRAVELKDGLLV